MATTLRQTDTDFEERFTAFLGAKREASADVDAVAEALPQVLGELRSLRTN